MPAQREWRRLSHDSWGYYHGRTLLAYAYVQYRTDGVAGQKWGNPAEGWQWQLADDHRHPWEIRRDRPVTQRREDAKRSAERAVRAGDSCGGHHAG